MSINGVNSMSAAELLYQMRAASARIEGAGESAAPAVAGGTDRVDFSDVLKRSLDQVNQAQQTSAELGRAFEAGDPNVAVSDLMVSMQKSSVSFQATVQVRNKLVAAYQEIMSMQV